jgi:hypothetical protein
MRPTSWRRVSGLVVVMLAAAVGAACDSSPSGTDCGWSKSRIEEVGGGFGDWREALADAAGDQLDSSTPNRYEVFADVREGEREDYLDEASCVFRQVNVAGNALSVRFALFDDASSLDRHLQWWSWPAVNEGADGVQSGQFNSPFKSREEDVNGVTGADFYCDVGTDDGCSQYSLVRQWPECSLLVVEASGGVGIPDRDDILERMLAATDDVFSYVTLPEHGVECEPSAGELTKFRGSSKSS